MSETKLTTLFSGIGAPEFAAREVFDEVETVFACEIDKYARQSYLANHEIDEAKFFTDIKEFDARPYTGQIDILIGGSPCQDFSSAGLRAGVCGSRGSLVWEYLRVLRECKPRVFVFENVKGLISVSHASAFYALIEEFRKLGYYCHSQVVNTKDYGIPQNRERLYIIGFLDADEYHAFSLVPKTGCGRLADYLDRDVNEKYFLSDEALAYFHSKHPKFNGKFEPRDENEGVATTITTKPGHRRTDTFIKVIGELDAKGSESIRRIYGTCGLAPTLTTATGGGHTPKILQRARIRKLTPRECLRLQGFPESFKIVVSDTQTYRQAGNAMSVNVVKMILEQIKLVKNKEFRLVG